MEIPQKIGLVQDALPFLGGAEKVLAAILELVPDAPIHTLIYDPEPFRGTVFEGHDIRTSPLNCFPLARRRHRAYLPLYPWAVERLDVQEHDVIVSLSYATAHGVLARPDQLHLAYSYTPLRQAWHGAREFRESLPRLTRAAADLVFHYVRIWDRAAAGRVDRFVAISNWIARCIRRAYGRESIVIYPPVDVEAFEPLSPRRDYYVALSRVVAHKRVDVLVEAFRELPYTLVVIGEVPQRNRLAADLPANVQLIGRCSNTELRRLLGRARALVHAAKEDFGIALVEAQAAGCPVIAYGRGGAAETVIPGRTGLLFPEQTASSAAAAVLEFESVRSEFRTEELVRNAQRFAKDRFQREFGRLLEEEWLAFRSRALRIRAHGGPSDTEAA